MEEMELLIDLHRGSQRQGPGGAEETQKALALAGVDPDTPLKIADIGCGTGASTLVLARLLVKAQITAVDLVQEFLDVLEQRAHAEGLSSKITSLCRSMDRLPFEDQAFDLIWSEGAIYNLGFAKGVTDWIRYLKPGGLLVVSEISWLTSSRPREIQEYWQGEYPEIDRPSSKLRVLEEGGYSPLGYFVLPESCWLDNYYRPLETGFEDFLRRNGNTREARKVVEAEKREIELYEKYSAYYSYGVYIAAKPDTKQA